MSLSLGGDRHAHLARGLRSSRRLVRGLRMLRTVIVALAFSAACGSRTAMPVVVEATATSGDSERCGNAIVEIDEECDDGNERDDDACTRACKTARCGDGFLWAQAELCDDGNQRDGDGCTRFCGPETCGDGI